MIYDITLHTKIKDMQMFLTADSVSSLYKRCLEMYRVQQNDVKINATIDENSLDINNKPKEVKIKPTVHEVEINELLCSKINGMTREALEAKQKYDYKLIETDLSKEHLDSLFSKYKKVKVYYERTGAKKNKKYIAICK